MAEKNKLSIEELQTKLEEATKKREEYVDYLRDVRKIYNPNYDKKYRELDDEVKDVQDLIDFYNIWELLSPIKSTLDEYKKAIKFDENCDSFVYGLTKYENKTGLRFIFRAGWLCGNIVYDDEGHIYYSKYTQNNERTCLGSCFDEKGVHNETDWLNDRPRFIDNEYMYIHNNSVNLTLYRLVDDKYQVVREFDKCSTFYTEPYLWKNHLIIVNGNSLYNLLLDKFVANFEFIHASLRTYDNEDDKHYYIPLEKKLFIEEDYKQFKDNVNNYMKDNNLMLLTNWFTVSYKDHSRCYKTMCFVDVKGNIVSKLYVASDNSGIFGDYEVTSATYSEVFNNIQEKLAQDLQQEVFVYELELASKKAIEEAKRTAFKEKNTQLLKLVEQGLLNNRP